MANKRSTAGSRGRDLFRTEVSSLLADLGELAGDESRPPAPPPAGSKLPRRVAAVPPGEPSEPVPNPPPGMPEPPAATAGLTEPAAAEWERGADLGTPVGVERQPEADLATPVGVEWHPETDLRTPAAVEWRPEADLATPVGVEWQPGADLATPVGVEWRPGADLATPAGVERQPGPEPRAPEADLTAARFAPAAPGPAAETPMPPAAPDAPPPSPRPVEEPPTPPASGWTVPPAPPPVDTTAGGSAVLDDLPSSSPSYLPPLPPILPPVAGLTPAPPSPPQVPLPAPQPPPIAPEWTSPWEPVIQPVTSTAWPEPSSSPEAGSWTGALDAMAPLGRDVAAPAETIHHHPAPLPEAWPAPLPPTPEAEADAFGTGLLGGSRGEPAPDPGTSGPETPLAERAWPWERETAPAISPVRAPGLPGWRLRPPLSPGHPPAPATAAGSSGWDSDRPEPGLGGPPRTPGTAADSMPGQRFRMEPAAAPTPPPEPAGRPFDPAGGDGWETSPATPEPGTARTATDAGMAPTADAVTAPAPEESWDVAEVPAPTRDLGLPPDSAIGLTATSPQVPGVTDIERIREALTPATAPRTAAGVAPAPPAAQRAGLPLLPGGAAAPVSTRPWSIDAAMQPLKPATPAPPRAGGAITVAEPPRVAPAKRDGGVNVPFPVVVAALIAVLAVIVVLILLSVRR